MTDAISCAPSVAVVITTFNHAHFLGDALDSVVTQTRPADEIVVVDDGSHDDPAAVVALFPQARLLRQDNAGLSAARNAGLAAITSELVIFLDADDLLCATAIERNLASFQAHPQAGLVYGGYERIDVAGRPLTPPTKVRLGDDALAAFLRCNPVEMHGTVLYSSAKLREVGGFDRSLKSCEDYDVYLKMAARYPVASHDEVVARYRIHEASMSADPVRMLRIALAVHAAHRTLAVSRSRLADWRSGRRHWKRTYADEALDGRWGTEKGGSLAAVLRILPLAPRRMAERAILALQRRRGARTR